MEAIYNMRSTKDFDRKKTIETLHTLASTVLELKQSRRQKRPIVIEFSGSPKSGKTSCINSLELFLKRNGFSVEIIHERANLCPVSDKQSPMFNIWTSFMSVCGMISVLERKDINCDCLILDRGIFDAFCWFNWLTSEHLMDIDQKTIIENVLTMESLVNKIDIVFAFSAKPEISIQREYAALLTDKLGTIMNPKVLSKYKKSIDATIKEKKQFFHKIFSIDTSDKSQDDVNKEVTQTTLRSLNDLLMEKIGYIKPTKEEWKEISKNRVCKYSNLKNILQNITFDLRETVEKSEFFLQPIPIAVITNTECSKVLVIKKTPKAVTTGSPEKDKLLLYVGGHSRDEDVTQATSSDFLTICRSTLSREIKEEIGINVALKKIVPFFIYTPDSEKSKKHIGVCFLVKLPNIDTIKLRLDPQELVLNKGTSKSGRFHEINSLIKDCNEWESWSVEILQKVFKITLQNNNYQFSFLDQV